MSDQEAVVATYLTHPAVDAAVKSLTQGGFAFKDLSVIGKGFHTDEKAVGFYSVGDRIKFWGERGAFWGGLWGLFFGGFVLSVPVLGQVVVLGYVATVLISALEGAVFFGGLSALGAAIVSIGFSKDSVVKYEAAIKSDGFILMVHGALEDVERARMILHATSPVDLEMHGSMKLPHEESAEAL
jgi:hypothetical protein